MRVAAGHRRHVMPMPPPPVVCVCVYVLWGLSCIVVVVPCSPLVNHIALPSPTLHFYLLLNHIILLPASCSTAHYYLFLFLLHLTHASMPFLWLCDDWGALCVWNLLHCSYSAPSEFPVAHQAKLLHKLGLPASSQTPTTCAHVRVVGTGATPALVFVSPKTPRLFTSRAIHDLKGSMARVRTGPPYTMPLPNRADRPGDTGCAVHSSPVSYGHVRGYG